MKISKFILVVVLLYSILAVFEGLALAEAYWAPAQRWGPEVLSVVKERWDGYEPYEGYFWTGQGMRWTQREIDNLKHGIDEWEREDMITHEYRGVYEFRRGIWNDRDEKTGNAMYENWDGVWARDEVEDYSFFGLFNWLGHLEQKYYSEYITSLPKPSNHGTEEYDDWFSKWKISLLAPNTPVSWKFDMCDVAEPRAGQGGCDEEYEISFDVYGLQADRYYFVAIKFRTDADSGSNDTRWHVKYEVQQYGTIPYIYGNKYACHTDSGFWRIEYDPSVGYSEDEKIVHLHCVDGNADGEADCDYSDEDDDNIAEYKGEEREDIPEKIFNIDNDGDQKVNLCDRCPDDPDNDADGDGLCGDKDPFPLSPDNDPDGDGILMGDNCLYDANPDQSDFDDDGVGDVCDSNGDDDGILDINDNCPLISNNDQLDTDGDGEGDACDDDDDDDGVSDGVDNCRFIFNPDQSDLNGNGFGDACDTDDDGDGVIDAVDNCPAVANSNQSNMDGDALGDACDSDLDGDGIENASDNCLEVPNPGQADNEGDGLGDICDPDDDDDGTLDVNDNCPLDSNSSQGDQDGDGLGDACDNDADNDGMPDEWENAHGLNPLDPSDAGADYDEDGDTSLVEYQNGTDPQDYCSPTQVRLCYDFYGDVGGQCNGATGVHCVPLNEWTPDLFVDTDGRPGGCYQSFSLRSICSVDLTICVDFQGDSPGADMGQCGNTGTHCAGVNEWTDPILLDMDARNGWCTERFFIFGQDEYTFFSDFWGDGASGDSGGQCKDTVMSKAYSATAAGTFPMGLDTDDRPGGCWQRFMIKRGTWSMSAF